MYFLHWINYSIWQKYKCRPMKFSLYYSELFLAVKLTNSCRKENFYFNCKKKKPVTLKIQSSRYNTIINIVISTYGKLRFQVYYILISGVF